MGNKYKYDDSDFIIGVENEEYVKEIELQIHDQHIIVMVTKEKEYYNIYIIDEIFQKEPMNNLHLQEPINCNNPEIEDYHLEGFAMSHFLWYRYNRMFRMSSEPME